jgi:hypothetical protein
MMSSGAATKNGAPGLARLAIRPPTRESVMPPASDVVRRNACNRPRACAGMTS